MSEFPSGWTFFRGQQWRQDPENPSLDYVDEAAVAPLPNGLVIVKYILLLGCQYSHLSRLNPERFPAAEIASDSIVGVPAIVYQPLEGREIIAIMPRAQWASAHIIGAFLRDKVTENDAVMAIDTSKPRWLSEYAQFVMTNRVQSGQIAIDSARENV